MSANFNTILILGATSGIGEAFTRCFHAQGKKVIAAGRRVERLEALTSELKGVESFQIDITEFATIESKIKQIIQAFPTLDTVCVFSGKLEQLSFMDPTTSTDESIVSETTLNFTAPLILARYFIPHLLTLKKPANFVLVTSGMAYIPFKFFPVYCATKAAIHYLAVELRSDLAGTNVNIIELVPPYVDTDLDAHCREDTIARMGGRENWHPPMPLEEFMSQAMENLAKVDEDGKPLKEVSVGFGALGAGAWRSTFGPIFGQFGIEG